MNEENRWNKTKLQKILFFVIVIVCLVTIFSMNRSIKSMQQELSMLRQEVGNLHSSVSSDINHISANIESSLKKESSIVSDYSYQVLADKINKAEGTVPLRVMARPKEHKNNLKASFFVESEEGKIFSAQGEEGEGYSFWATIEVPLNNNLKKLSVSFDDGTVQKTEILEEIYELSNRYMMKVDSTIQNMNIMNNNHKLEYSGAVETYFSMNMEGNNYPVSGEIRFQKDGTLIKKIPVNVEKLDDSAGRNNESHDLYIEKYVAGESGVYTTSFNETIAYKKDSLIEIVVIINDNLGFQYKQTIYGERIDENGEPYLSDYSNEVIIE